MTLQAIEQLADRLIEEAYMLQASDIHIVPRKQDALVQFRLGGMLVTKMCYRNRRVNVCLPTLNFSLIWILENVVVRKAERWK